MALVDICKWLSPFNTRHPDPCFYPVPFPLPLSGLSTPGSRSPSVGPQGSRPKTPDYGPSNSYGGPGSTPSARGSGVRKKVEGNSDRVDNYKCSDYDEYIHHDLRNRVFVDFEVFLKSVLHVPADWKTLWKSDIEAVRKDDRFGEHYNKYRQRCEMEKPGEQSFYKPLMDTANAVLTVISSTESNNVSGNPQYYHVNDPNTLRGGVINKSGGLIPDLVVLHEDCRPPDGKNLHWANVLHVLEVKPLSSAICDGDNVYKLMVDGKTL